MILKETFRSGGKYKNELMEIQASLCTKNWLIHLWVNLGRILYPIFGNAFWQRGYDKYKEDDAIDQVFVEESKHIVQIVIISFIPLGIILDLVCWRYRHLSSLIFYFELVSLVIQSFVPWDFGDFRPVIVLVILGSNFILYSNGSVGNIIGCTLGSLVIELFCHQFILAEEFKFGTLSGAMLNAVSIFIIVTVLSMLVTYIA